MSEEEKDEYEKAVGTLCDRLETGSKVMAAQDFRHLMQEDKEKVIDFIHRLEWTFWLAYGHDKLLPEARDGVLFPQMQEGLKYSLMESPAVSGATSYQNLCVAGKSEERRQGALTRRRQCDCRRLSPACVSGKLPTSSPEGGQVTTQVKPLMVSKESSRKCWNCDKVGHVARDCQQPK